jgi:hypothetical protein
MRTIRPRRCHRGGALRLRRHKLRDIIRLQTVTELKGLGGMKMEAMAGYGVSALVICACIGAAQGLRLLGRGAMWLLEQLLIRVGI